MSKERKQLDQCGGGQDEAVVARGRGVDVELRHAKHTGVKWDGRKGGLMMLLRFKIG